MEKTAAEKTNSPRRRWWRKLLPVVVGGSLLALVLSRTDLARLWQVLSRAQWQWYALAQVLLIANMLLLTARWRYDLGLLNIPYPFGKLFLIDHASALAGAATPGRMGDLARLIYFRHEKHLLIRVGLSILVERFFDLVVLVCLCAGFLRVFPLPEEFQRLVWRLVLLVAFVGMASSLIVWRFWGRDWLRARALRLLPTNVTDWFCHNAQEFKATLRCYVTWRLVWPLTLTFLAWGCSILAAYLSARSLGLPLSLWQTGACFCLSTLFTLIPMSVAGIGTRELAMVFLFSCLGLPSEQALAFSFLLLGFLLTHAVVGFGSLILNPPHPWREKKEPAVSV